MVEDLLQRAISAYKAGRKDEARDVFMDIVEQDPRHEQAWLYLSALVDSPEEQQICLENVLTVNPNNEKAKQGLATIKQKLSGQQRKMPFDPTADVPSGIEGIAPDAGFASPFGGSPPIGAEFESGKDLFGESIFGDSVGGSSPAFGNDFDLDAAITPDTGLGSDDPFSWLNDTSSPPVDRSVSPASPLPPASTDDFDHRPTSSVDWGRDDQPATYGSGRHIDEPTSDEYDEWMDSLPLGGETAGSQDSSSTFGVAPFGDTSFMVDDDSYVDDRLPHHEQSNDSFWNSSSGTDASTSPSAGSFATFGAQSAGFPDAAGSIDDDLFDSVGEFAEDEFEEPSRFGMSAVDSPSFFDEPEPVKSDSSGFDFTFDDDSLDAQVPSRTNEVGAKSRGKSSARHTPALQLSAEHYRLIPAEIEPLEGGISRHTVMLIAGIAVMVVLNSVSLALLAM